MNTALVAIPNGGEMTVWRLVDNQPASPQSRRRPWWVQLGVFCLGLSATIGLAVAVGRFTQPDTIVQTRILADGPAGTADRAALSDLVLRLTGSARAAILEDGGDSLVVSAKDADPAKAWQQARSLVDAILNAPVPTNAVSLAPEPGGPAVELRAERTRLRAAADAVSAQAAAVSSSLTALVRDAAAASRDAAEHKPGRETLDKGNAALADLQLQRLQLVSKYQDTYPAVLSLDGQIRNLQVLLVDEAHRIEVHPVGPGATDALLTSERDRLQAALASLDDRRRNLATRLAALDQKLAALPAVAIAGIPAVAPAPMLIAAATTSFADANGREAIVPAVAGVGFMLTVAASLLARRRRSARYPGGLVLEPMSGGLLPGATPRAMLPLAPGAIGHDGFRPPLGQSNWQGRP